MSRYKIVCGNPGTGKSTFVKRKYKNYFLISCDIPFAESTYSIIESSLSPYFKKAFSDYQELLNSFYALLSKEKGVIIDNAEKIDADSLTLVVNLSKMFNLAIIFIFDVSYTCLHKIDSFMKLIEWDIIDINEKLADYQVELNVLERFVQHECPTLETHECETILHITGYNFNEIKKLIWINKIISNGSSKISEKAISEYRINKIEMQLSQLAPKLSEVLKKSSIIGQVFEKYPLESAHGFHILGLSNYLHDLELLGTFISKLIYKKDYYHFITPEIYDAISSSIHSSQKCEWQEILLNFYIYKFNHSSFEYEKKDLLFKARQAAIELTDDTTVTLLNRVLLYQFLLEEDYNKAITIIDELIVNDCAENKTYLEYLLLLKLRLLLCIGDYRRALDITNQYVLSPNYAGGEDNMLYYHVRCLYNCGDIDSAFFYVKLLIKKLKNTSKAGVTEQQLYPLAYSIMASIQNHLGIEDQGKRYYRTALNFANNNLKDKNIYFSILSKCDMFYSSNLAVKCLSECVEYFTKEKQHFNAAKVCFNLATELLFNGSNQYEIIEKYFSFAKHVFQLPDEHLAYAKNNHALFQLMVKKNFYSAAEELESALFVGLSDFTYMTIYLNLSMCYYYLYGNQNASFVCAYEKFKKYEKNVESRKNRTRYEIVYRIISEIVFFNRSTMYLRNELQEYQKNNQNDMFFKMVIRILTSKSHNELNLQPDDDNIRLFQFVNEFGLFLAEFRFWE